MVIICHKPAFLHKNIAKSFCKSNVPPNTPTIILVSKTLYERYKFTYLLVREIRKQVTLNECQLNILYSILYCNVAKRLENEI
jgi:hypothetical protein